MKTLPKIVIRLPVVLPSSGASKSFQYDSRNFRYALVTPSTIDEAQGKINSLFSRRRILLNPSRANS